MPDTRIATGHIRTVFGQIAPADFGLALPHEHVLVDFTGAVEPPIVRWDRAEVVGRMRPLLLAVKAEGVTGFADCTPAYLGRDVLVLRQLAEETGLHILTNTGYYAGAGDKYVPPHAWAATAEQLAEEWIAEATDGIEGTGILPGFIKIASDAPEEHGALSAIDAKLVDAAALASTATGLFVASHTEGSLSGLAVADRFLAAGGRPDRLAIAHSDGHDFETNLAIASRGVWISFDGVGRRPIPDHADHVAHALKEFPNQILLSQDSGYWAGELPDGGAQEPYTTLTSEFLPALRERGITNDLLSRVTVNNPARAFTIG
jgi:predicted metal-dependent phosphotriesterase family hydrolase